MLHCVFLVRPASNWSLFGDLANDYYWIRWPPILAARTLERLEFTPSEQIFVAAFLVHVTPYSEEVLCNISALARAVNVSAKTAQRALDRMFKNGLLRIEIGAWDNQFQSKFKITELVTRLREAFAEVAKTVDYNQGKIDGK